MKRATFFSLSIIMVVAMSHCGDVNTPLNDLQTETGQELETQGAKSVTPFVLQTQDGLRIELRLLDGVKPKTKKNRFLHATVSRGSNSFQTWCNHRRGDFKEYRPTEKLKMYVSCGKNALTVSGDDDETLSFVIAQTLAAPEAPSTYVIREASYVGDGTILGDAALLFDPKGKSMNYINQINNMELIPKLIPGPDAHPFTLINDTVKTLATLLGERVYEGEETETMLPIRGFDFGIETNQTIHPMFYLGKNGKFLVMTSEPVSLLNVPGNLSSGYANADTIVSRIQALLPVAP